MSTYSFILKRDKSKKGIMAPRFAPLLAARGVQNASNPTRPSNINNPHRIVKASNARFANNARQNSQVRKGSKGKGGVGM